MKRCCKQCGRDTSAVYCSSCSPYYRFDQRDEQRVRPKDKIETHDEDLTRDEAESSHGYNPPPKVDPYHGSTTRDDI